MVVLVRDRLKNAFSLGDGLLDSGSGISIDAQKEVHLQLGVATIAETYHVLEDRSEPSVEEGYLFGQRGLENAYAADIPVVDTVVPEADLERHVEGLAGLLDLIDDLGETVNVVPFLDELEHSGKLAPEGESKVAGVLLLPQSLRDRG